MTRSAKCRVKDDLVKRLVSLNSKLNTLSPNWLQSEEARAEVQQQRETVYAEIVKHRAKGHDGKPCPAARHAFNPSPRLSNPQR